MAKRQWVWVKDKGLSDKEKAAIAEACTRFIADVLKPRFLPEIRPTQFNYPIDITGRWRGHRYSFIQRFRSDSPDSIAPEFDSAFARLDHVEGEHFDLMWHRHTGQWLCLQSSVTLAEALRLIETEPLVQPLP